MRSAYFGFVALVVFAWPSLASADLLSDIKANGALRLAVRQDAPPFSSKNDKGDYVGYSVALCRAVAEDIKKQLDLSALKVELVPVTAEDRLKAIAEKKADLLCEATSVTLTRRAELDFSIPTFVSGAGLAIREGGPADFKALAGHKIGVLGGTTTEEALKNSLSEQKIKADVVPAKSHDEGLAALEDGSVDAYFADRTILRYRLAARKSPMKLLLSENYLTIEPYALGLPLGENSFRIAVDRSLSKLYRSGAIVKLFRESFGKDAKPTALQKALYTISGLPE